MGDELRRLREIVTQVMESVESEGRHPSNVTVPKRRRSDLSPVEPELTLPTATVEVQPASFVPSSPPLQTDSPPEFEVTRETPPVICVSSVSEVSPPAKITTAQDHNQSPLAKPAP